MFDLPYCLPPTDLYAEIRAAGYELSFSGLQEVPMRWVGVWIQAETGNWYLTSLKTGTDMIACVEASGQKTSK